MAAHESPWKYGGGEVALALGSSRVSPVPATADLRPSPASAANPNRAPGRRDRGCAEPGRSRPSGEQRAFVVELDYSHGAVRRGVEAQPAEHTLVEVLLDDLEAV